MKQICEEMATIWCQAPDSVELQNQLGVTLPEEACVFGLVSESTCATHVWAVKKSERDRPKKSRRTECAEE